MELTNLSNIQDRYGLSDVQYEAVSYGSGPLLVLAGPGSGKTTVITHRIRHLIEQGHIPPQNILVVTFSRAAAIEMKERFTSFHVDHSERVTFGTFHSVYFNLIKLAYGYTGDQVVSDDERYRIIRGLIDKYKLSDRDVKTLSVDLLSEIALVKEEKISVSNYYSSHCSAEVFRHIYEDYEDNIGRIRKIDFEDMLLMTYDLLQGRDDIRTACQKKYQYILVDEFQDINRMQYEIIRMIAGDTQNLTMVGDDDQSIYRFRGAKPEIMLGLKRDFSSLHTIILDANYRSTSQIVDAALRLVGHNTKRYAKKLYAVAGKGRDVDYTEYKDSITEARSIADDIRAYIQSGYHYGDMAVLYRTNIQPRLLTSVLMEYGIPFTIDDTMPDIMEHFIAKDILAYLKLSRSLGSRADLIRIANRPLRYIKREAMNDADVDMDAMKEYYEDNSYMRKNIDKFEDDLSILSSKSTSEGIRYIRSTIGYDGFLEEYAKDRELDIMELYAVADELEDSGMGFYNPQEWVDKQAAYRREIEDIRRRDRKNRDTVRRDAVRLMTMHASKGLEFKIVYILDANEGITPYRKAISADDIEEERRMFYVAMTRAKERLSIGYCNTKMHRGVPVSRFVTESRLATNNQDNKENKR